MAAVSGAASALRRIAGTTAVKALLALLIQPIYPWTSQVRLWSHISDKTIVSYTYGSQNDTDNDIGLSMITVLFEGLALQPTWGSLNMRLKLSNRKPGFHPFRHP